MNRNIRYYRNEANIRDRNFPKVLDYARGEYLKLLNDCVYLNNESLHYIKECIAKYKNQSNALFFTSGYIYTAYSDVIVLNSLDDYIRAVSIGTTNNNMFGCWRRDWETIQEKARYALLKLQQVDWSCQIVNNNKITILCNRDVLTYCSTPQMTRTKYNWFKVHLDNYYTILQPYHENGDISDQTLKNDRKVLLNFYKPFLYQIYLFHRNRGFDTKGTMSIFYKWYKHDSFFYLFFLTMPFSFVFRKAVQFVRRRI